jgi:hypothetical protein
MNIMTHEPMSPLDNAVKAEWDALRAEIATRDAQSFQLMTGSITVATGLLTLFAALAKNGGNFNMPIALYYVPFAIMLPAFYLILNNAHCSTRIAAYIEFYLEARSALEWEGAPRRFYTELRRDYGSRRFTERYGALPFEEVRVMYVVFLGLATLDALVFWTYGAWSSLGKNEAWLRPLLLAIPFVVFLDGAVRAFGRHSARERYADIWKSVSSQPSE